MFPKVLPSLLIKKLAASLLEVAYGGSTSDVLDIETHGEIKTFQLVISDFILISHFDPDLF